MPAHSNGLDGMKLLSPRRNTTHAGSVDELTIEQLRHFGIDPESEFGRSLGEVARHLYESQRDLGRLCEITAQTVHTLAPPDRIAQFNAKKFLSFQLAKLLDTLQNPNRKSYQSLGYTPSTLAAKGPYAVFDNVAAIFAANPVITRSATYIYACAEWIEDAFLGKELLLEIYSRLLNPTSIALANQIVDIECGRYAPEYFAWNFNSGMAAIDAALSHLLGRDDILITSRNIYGGAYQLIHDWFAKPSNLAVAVEMFDGFEARDVEKAIDAVKRKYPDRLVAGRRIYLYIESPCNPHGDVLDVAGMCRVAHREHVRVVLDATVATPFLARPLTHPEETARPDFVIHSYTKDLHGGGSVLGGVVIGRTHDMFAPKGTPAAGNHGIPWNETLFWNVYYIKGAFLPADPAFDVLQGIRTLDVRMLHKCINTRVLGRFLASHPRVKVRGHGILEDSSLYLGLPSPLFTVDFGTLPREAFQRFFDNLSPTFGHMVSLGQSNTIVSCPALTTHSELDEAAQRKAGLTPTMVRVAVGDEDCLDLISHLIHTAQLTLDPVVPGYSQLFPTLDDARQLYRDTYLEVHRRYIGDRTGTERDERGWERSGESAWLGLHV
jgi:O-acetylhomoserine/O-acetylserine sulfhydrylase-like pyridoxal-dependent enzyme